MSVLTDRVDQIITTIDRALEAPADVHVCAVCGRPSWAVFCTQCRETGR